MDVVPSTRIRADGGISLFLMRALQLAQQDRQTTWLEVCSVHARIDHTPMRFQHCFELSMEDVGELKREKYGFTGLIMLSQSGLEMD